MRRRPHARGEAEPSRRLRHTVAARGGTASAALALLLAVVAVGPGPTEAAAQEELPPAEEPAGPTEAPDTAPPPPPAYEPPRFAFGLTLGTLGMDGLQNQPATALQTDLGGAVTGSVPLTRSVRADGGLEVGAYGVASLDRRWALRLSGAWSETTLSAGYEGEDDAVAGIVDRLVGREAASIRMLTGELALRYRMLSGTRLEPYLELGAVGVRWEGGAGDAARGLDSGEIRLGAMAAAGLVYPITPWLAATAAASYRVFRSPLGIASPDTVPLPTALTLVYDRPAGAPFADGTREVLTALRFDLGLSVELRGPGDPERPDRPGTAAPPPPPGR